MNELSWFLLPVSGFLWMAGGTWKKQFRRIGIPLCIFSFVFLFSTPWFSWLLSSILFFIATTLPITLKGDSIPAHAINWVWIFVLGLIFWVISFPCGFSPAVPLLFGFIVTFSNLPQTRKFFPWKLCEFLFGAITAYPYAYLVGS
jgi:hypothetical protein